MTYIRVTWHHAFDSEPVVLYSELDESRIEIRKVEIFRDGTRGYAGGGTSSHGTELGLVPLPDSRKISDDPEFEVEEVTRGDFEDVWAARG